MTLLRRIVRLLPALLASVLCAAIAVVYAQFWPWPAYGLGLVLVVSTVVWAAD